LFDDLQTQFHNQILVKFLKFRDLRLAGVMGNQELALAGTDCAAALFHFREHIPAAHRLSRKDVSAQCPDYKLIADVTNAVKHGAITRTPPGGPALLNSSADIYELAIIVQYECGTESYSHHEALVCVDCTDGKRRCLDEALVNVVNHWGLELNRLGVRSFTPFDHVPFPGSTLIKKEDARSITIGATQGLPFRARFQLMKFDYEAGFARPVDLAGTDINTKFHRLEDKLEFKVNIPSIDEQYVHTIDLSGEQSQEYLAMKTDTERQAFYARIAGENRNEIESGLAAWVERRSRDAID